MRCFLIFSILLCRAYGFAQPLRKVLDKQTGLPVSYATVKVLHQPRGVIASDKGEFVLSLDRSDSVLFSCVGYEEKILIGGQIDTIIFLFPKIKTLSQVTIGKKIPARSIVLGEKIKRSKDERYWLVSSAQEEFAQRIDIPDSSHVYKIKKVIIPTGKYTCPGSLLLRIYTPDSITGLPGEPLLLKFVEVRRSGTRKEVIIELGGRGPLSLQYCFFLCKYKLA
jgi:hypothetical protein